VVIGDKHIASEIGGRILKHQVEIFDFYRSQPEERLKLEG
jgi:hypothetical protein